MTAAVDHFDTFAISDDEKRQILYSALLRHFPEAKPLRSRALERLVLGALYGTDANAAATVGDIQSVLALDSHGTSLRVETIQDVLRDLIEGGFVGETTRRKKHAYYLTANATRDLADKIDGIARLLNGALQRVVRGCEQFVSTEIALKVVKRFICQCFARFGRHIAKTVIGDLRQDELINQVDVDGAFDAASRGHELSRRARETLRARCVEFLRSTHPDDERLKYYFTQGYYFAHLLGVEERGGIRVSELVSTGNRFYLDTNIVIRRLLSPADSLDSFTEIAGVAKRLSFDVRVTRATVNEARRVAALRAEDLKLIIERLPEEVAERTRDNFLSAYLDARAVDPELTVDEFLSPFDRIREILASNYGIEVDERVEDDVLDDDDMERTAQTLQKYAIETRGWGKGENALRHDVAEYKIVLGDRNTSNERTWLLTQDRSLVRAAVELRREDEQPFCIPLIGLLQTLSPYVEATEEQSFADVFSKLLLDIVPPLEDVYDIQDLRVLAQIQDDVQQTTPEKLVEAYDYVRNELSSRPADRRYDPAQIVLGLRRFLASSDDEQKRALAVQLEQAKRDSQRIATDADVRDRMSAEEVANVKQESKEAVRERDEARRRADGLTLDLRNLRISTRIERRRDAAVVLFGCMLVAAVMWLLSSAMARGFAFTYRIHPHTIEMCINGLAAILCLSGGLIFIRRCETDAGTAAALLTICGAIALFFSGAISDPLGAVASSLLQIASALSLLIAQAIAGRVRTS